MSLTASYTAVSSAVPKSTITPPPPLPTAASAIGITSPPTRPLPTPHNKTCVFL
ncbi:hypothetical protein Syun_031545 [Stephania yunnanensis]|uniref:Uncharacterized protein n=1 Tax=Stephania yunnanensis TaxID=152371 RepID=A0AAP0E0Q1_9MAGN